MSPTNKIIHFTSDISTAALRCLPAELAHEIGMSILSKKIHRLLPKPKYISEIDLTTEIEGIGRLWHPIGLAAGFDKNASAVEGFNDLDFSFIEVGTVTPRPQLGNKKPRLFRLKDQNAIINRMGFNNHGLEVMRRTLSAGDYGSKGITLGINLGKNKDTPMEAAVNDYIDGLFGLKEHGKYFVVNISSPNTPGLRDLASKDFLRDLAYEITLKDAELIKRVWVKVDPDLDKDNFQSLIEGIKAYGYAGVILTNTHRVELPEMGGQSGHPLAVMSTLRLEWAYEASNGSLPMIGVGGIMSGGDVYQKIIRGAKLVQIYSSLVYRGPWVVLKLLEELEWELQLHGHKNLQDACGSFYR